ncbi:Peptidase A4 family protein [Streptomyces sp. DvalAA-14]|uniref:G1 family glutamic endopeptidase n=1 Tax=unclassified Streptomyces TaxID=2593676 RepID=UPI00081B0C79|nr:MULTISPECIES: G1 family glutamic endopeptidase [unclassified Streptomyces]MYS23652.1 hypothetical protein [Streptomyces sp. SID4948]SCE36676.1 Peptidase A4 family protein [Streptomyces sp. DvalAA-14]
MTPLRRLPAVLALSGALLAGWSAAWGAAPARAAAPHGVPFTGGSGESGYVATGGRYTSVSAAWTQPQLACSTDGSDSTSSWVGLDGATDRTVEQAGTSGQCSGTTAPATMYAWYELYPAYPVTSRIRSGPATPCGPVSPPTGAAPSR